jgi:hypothetical protein
MKPAESLDKFQEDTAAKRPACVACEKPEDGLLYNCYVDFDSDEFKDERGDYRMPTEQDWTTLKETPNGKTVDEVEKDLRDTFGAKPVGYARLRADIGKIMYNPGAPEPVLCIWWMGDFNNRSILTVRLGVDNITTYSVATADRIKEHYPAYPVRLIKKG